MNDDERYVLTTILWLVVSTWCANLWLSGDIPWLEPIWFFVGLGVFLFCLCCGLVAKIVLFPILLIARILRGG